MKIAFVTDDSLDRPDGVQQYVLTVGAWLSEQGHEVHYLAGSTSRTDLQNVHSLARNVQVTFNGNGLTTPLPAGRRAIKRLLETEKFDILHVQMPYSPMLAHKVIMNAPGPTVIVGTFHILPYSWLVRYATRVLGWWLRRSLQRFDRVFAVSPAAQPFAAQAFGIQSVSVLPNVAKLGSFGAAAPMPGLATGDNRPVIMFLGRLVARKGCDTFLDAAARLKQIYPHPFNIVVCGKGPLLADLQAQAGRLGIGDAVTFTGFVSEADKPRYMSAAAVMAFPSTGGESFGIVLIEAMAAGKPVVLAASNPGYASVMEPQPQLLFAPGDAASLADKMALYLQDEAARNGVVGWQREYVKQFDVAVVGSRLEAEYRQLMENKLHNKLES